MIAKCTLVELIEGLKMGPYGRIKGCEDIPIWIPFASHRRISITYGRLR
jgi:hypothetical protein